MRRVFIDEVNYKLVIGMGVMTSESNFDDKTRKSTILFF